ncbi:MAG: Mov34/MPN/PAD-1 family protein [Gammaproteobacteria bacterium]
MHTTEIQIPRKITNQLLHFAQISPDAEICGLIGSIDGQPCHCYPVGNCSEQPENRFQLDAKQQIAAMTQMRERGEELFAIYHSHPCAPAAPSTTDLAQSAYPEALNLIISLNTKGVLEMRGYRIINHKAEEIPLRLA